MQLEEHYKELLGLGEDWKVERVRLNVKGRQVDIWLEHSREKAECPNCQSAGAYYGRGEERKWRHLETMRFATVLHASVPRVCSTNCSYSSSMMR